nr:hypothetical protein [Tanacetum cinerariifolium]
MANDKDNHALIIDEETPTEFALMAKTSAESEVFDNSLSSKAYKKNSDSLNIKITELTDKLYDAKNMIHHYKLGLAQVKARLAEHRSQELKYCFQTASKDLDSLLESQRLDKNKEGLGYSDVPPPPAQIYSPPKKDRSWTGLPEFKDDTVTDYSRPLPTIKSTLDDAQNKNPFVTKTEASPNTISPKPFVKFVKTNDCPTKSKTDKVVIAKKPPVKKFPTSSIKFSTADLGKKENAVKASACWFWKRSQNLSNKGPNSNSVSVMFKKYTYIDTQGRLKHMTGNISYLSDYEPFNGGYVSFGQGGCKITGKGTIKTECIVFKRDFKLLYDATVLLRTPRQHNMYSIDLNNIVPHKDLTCLVAKASANEGMLWHRRLGHLNFKIMNRLVRHNLVRGLPSKCFENDHTCSACLKGKQHKASCKSKLVNSVTKPLHTLHIDLFSPTSDETSGILKKFITEIENLKDLKVKIIRCDNGGEFRNKEMDEFYAQKGIKSKFSNARTPQQNGVAERGNRTLIKAARTMLADAKLPVTFWAKAINTACYVQNMVLVNKSHNKTPYELFNGRSPAIGFLKPFGCYVMILNTFDHLGKFEAKGDEGYFIRYSMSSKAFRVFNKRTKRVEENLHVEFLENKAIEKGAGLNWLFDIDSLTKSMNYVPVVAGTNSTNLLESSSSKPQDDCNTDVPESSGNSNPTATSTNPSADQMETLTVETPIPTISSPVLTACFTDSQEPSNILGVITNSDESNGVEANVSNMETTITASPTSTLRIHKDHPKSQIIGPVDTPIQTRNKSKENIFDALQDPSWVEAMQEELLQFKIQNVWTLVDCPKRRGTIDQTLFIRRQRGEFILVQVYVDDIIFGSSNPQLCKEFEALMHEKFQMSAMGELNFFLGLQVLQKEDGIFLSQDKPDIMFVVCAYARHQVTPKECHLHAVKRIFRYIKGSSQIGALVS